MLVNISPGDDSSGGTRERLTVEGRADTAIGTAMENGDVRGGRKRGDQRGTGIYACEPERPLYVVDAIIYDTYRSQLRVMALTLVFMAILFLVAFHGRRRLAPSVSSSSPHRCLFLGDFGPYAKQAVILV